METNGNTKPTIETLRTQYADVSKDELVLENDTLRRLLVEQQKLCDSLQHSRQMWMEDSHKTRARLNRLVSLKTDMVRAIQDLIDYLPQSVMKKRYCLVEAAIATLEEAQEVK